MARALASGARGRGFKSHHPDSEKSGVNIGVLQNILLRFLIDIKQMLIYCTMVFGKAK